MALLDHVWPSWPEALAALTASGLPPTPEGWRKLADDERAGRIGPLPASINRRTAAALTAADSKASLSATHRAALGATQVTHDGIVRLRCPLGVRVHRGDRSVDLGAVAAVLGEVGLPERAFLDGVTLDGIPRALLLIENLGAWRDLPSPEGWLLAHVPGWDTSTVRHLLSAIGETPVIHFGDLDPNGVRIYGHLRAMRPGLRWFVPSFWGEKLDQAAPKVWPTDVVLDHAPSLVQKLAANGRWLEQETIVLDSRIAAALEAALADPGE